MSQPQNPAPEPNPSPKSPEENDAAAAAGKPFEIGLKTDEELKQLARDIVAGHVLTDRAVAASVNGSLDAKMAAVQSSFMILALCDETVLEALTGDPANGVPSGLVYEYYSQASERSVNGRPMFLSAQLLHGSQVATLHGYVVKVAEALKNI